MIEIYKNIEDVVKNRQFLRDCIGEGFSLDEIECKISHKHRESIVHMIRCAESAKSFAKYLGFDDETVDIIEESALLHDIGKLSIDPSILYKTEPLNDVEWRIVKAHSCVDGIESIGLDNRIVDSIKYHHCFVGEYSDDVVSDVVKIVGLVDAFDAMMNKRCYRMYGMNVNEVIGEIACNLGIQFDVYYGELFVKYIEDSYNSYDFVEVVAGQKNQHTFNCR